MPLSTWQRSPPIWYLVNFSQLSLHLILHLFLIFFSFHAYVATSFDPWTISTLCRLLNYKFSAFYPNFDETALNFSCQCANIFFLVSARLALILTGTKCTTTTFIGCKQYTSIKKTAPNWIDFQILLIVLLIHKQVHSFSKHSFLDWLNFHKAFQFSRASNKLSAKTVQITLKLRQNHMHNRFHELQIRGTFTKFNLQEHILNIYSHMLHYHLPFVPVALNIIQHNFPRTIR